MLSIRITIECYDFLKHKTCKKTVGLRLIRTFSKIKQRLNWTFAENEGFFSTLSLIDDSFRQGVNDENERYNEDISFCTYAGIKDRLFIDDKCSDSSIPLKT